MNVLVNVDGRFACGWQVAAVHRRDRGAEGGRDGGLFVLWQFGWGDATVVCENEVPHPEDLGLSESASGDDQRKRSAKRRAANQVPHTLSPCFVGVIEPIISD